jgi:PAS domain S-box-containing protein
MSSLTDIAERKRMEERLAWQAGVLDTIMANTGAKLVYLDRDFNFILANRAYIEGCGHSWEELKGKNHFGFFPNEENEAIFRKARDTGEVVSFHDKPFEFADQPWRGVTYWDWTLVPIKDSSGEVTGLVLSLIDTTERKKAEQIKDEFIGIVSHELRTPLTVINGSLKVARNKQLSPEEVDELLQNAIENTEKLSDILENMLELSRHQAGRLQLNIERISIGNIASKAADELRAFGAAQGFVIEIPEDLPPLDADPLRVERVLRNLLENAVKYSPEESQIKILVQMDGNYLITSIIDQGKGISENNMGQLFKQFQRVDQRSVEGTGLGLVVCERLVEAHGGWIKAESELGQGSTFSFGLPLQSKSS